jgi:hypothetical protein
MKDRIYSVTEKNKILMSKEYTIGQLNNKLLHIDGMYQLISEKKYLPSRSSKAISREYLHQILTDSTIWLPPSSTTRHAYLYMGVGQEELVKVLSGLVKTQN